MNNISLTTSQKKAIEAFLSGKNVFLSGEAGTGKSFVLNAYLSSLSEKNVLVCAPTGIAAINVGGVTLHSAFQIPLCPLGSSACPESVSEELLYADVIVIDEISMCRFDVFQYVAASIQMAEEQSGRHKQLILIGDFYQLPPVITPPDRKVLNELWGKEHVKDGYAFQAPLWASFDFEYVLLKEIVRQKEDVEFLKHLNLLREGDVSAVDWINGHAAKSELPGICLCPTNREVNRRNQEAADNLDGEYVEFHSTVYGRVSNNDKPTADLLRLKTGMQVMAVRNDPEGRYQNGSLGIIESIDTSKQAPVTVRFFNGNIAEIEVQCWEVNEYIVNDDQEVELKPVGWFYQLPLKPAYAITIHKSQGQTFDQANLSPKCFSNGQLYVAVSRLTSIAGLHLTAKIKPSNLMVSEEVLHFYRQMTA